MTIHPYFEQMKLAMGGAAWDSVSSLQIRYSLMQGGVTGTVEQLRSVLTGRYVETFSLGVLSGTEGLDRTSPWSSDSGKLVRREQNTDTLMGASNCAYLHCLAYWYPERWAATVVDKGTVNEGGRDYYLLHITPEGGRLLEYWIDCETCLLDMTVENTAFQKITRKYAEYQNVNGLLIPHYVRTSVGDVKYDRVCDLESVAINPEIPAHAFDPPIVKQHSLTFIDNTESCQIKFQLISNLIVLGVSINGSSPLPFILDSGGVNIVTPETASYTGLNPEGLIWGFGAGPESVDMQVTKIETIDLGGISLQNQVVYVYPFPELTEVLRFDRFGGILGYELFRHAVITIDYQRSLLTFARPEVFHYRGEGTVVPFLYNNNIPEVRGSIDGIEGNFGVDTGNTGALILNAPFVYQNSLMAKYHPDDHTIGVGAGGGNSELAVAHASHLQIGEAQVHDLAIALSQDSSVALSNPYSAGLVGADVLKRFLVIFDYSRQQIILQKH